jgi:hypothetical protein
MAKEQKRGNRETKKPKTKVKVVANASAPSVKGLMPPIAIPKKKG